MPWHEYVPSSVYYASKKMQFVLHNFRVAGVLLVLNFANRIFITGKRNVLKTRRNAGVRTFMPFFGMSHFFANFLPEIR